MSDYSITKAQPRKPDGPSAFSRRQVLKRGGLFAAGAGALLGSGGLAAAEGFTTESSGGRDSLAQTADLQQSTLELDVACDGNTLVINRSPGVDPDAPVQRGDPFIVNGRIFPAGTIEQGLEQPNQEGSIGTWICRGWFYYGLEEMGEGAVPHVVTTQLYLLDNYDGLISEGIEGGLYALRPVTGGYGQYAGARGFVEEDEIATNATELRLGGGFSMPAPNIWFRFHFAE